MQPPWPIGKILAVVVLIVALVFVILAMSLPGFAVHLGFWTLILLAILAFAVVLL